MKLDYSCALSNSNLYIKKYSFISNGQLKVDVSRRHQKILTDR